MGWRVEERLRTSAVPAAALGAALVAHAAPALTVLPGIRLRFFPRLSGRGVPGHVALTFDDGPDPVSTPHFLETLAAYRIRATFFLLGSMLVRAPELGLELVAAGHEVAVHGWSHRNLLLVGPRATYRELARTRELVQAVTGRPPRLFRPPYGVLTAAALATARGLGLTPVLWTCWGRDWEPDRHRLLGAGDRQERAATPVARCCCTTPTAPPHPAPGAPAWPPCRTCSTSASVGGGGSALLGEHR